MCAILYGWGQGTGHGEREVLRSTHPLLETGLAVLQGVVNFATVRGIPDRKVAEFGAFGRFSGLMQQDDMATLSGVRKVYREGDRRHVVLDGVDASIRRGEWVALLGPSGSGKTTVLNILSGIDYPDEGRVVVDGVALTDASERERTLFRRHHIGFVFQFFNLLPTLTVEENLLLPLELAGGNLREGSERARSLLEEVGLADRAGTYPDRLSGGERQRVALARAVIHDPALVLADEPTGNLDSETGERMLAFMESALRSRGKTVLTVTHSPEVAARADRVIELRGGHLRDRP